MNNILKAWNAGFVRRWHTQPELCDTIDYDSGHQHRCTVLLLLFWPDAPDWLVIATIIHDQGECDAGDMAGPAKTKHPEISTLLQIIESESIKQQGFSHRELTAEEKRRVKFVDYLDSYIWMLRHKSSMSRKVEWKKQLKELYEMADNLSVSEKFSEFMDSANKFYIV